LSVSLLFGHIGRFNVETGLHVLYGSAQDVTLDHRHLQQIAESRSGYEINSNAPFTCVDPSKKDAFKFLNKAEYHASNAGDFSVDLEMLTDKASDGSETIVGSMSNSKSAAFRLLNTEQWSPKVYSNRIIGLVPPSVFLKMILKQKGSKTKRVIMFACGISQELGGRTWFCTPQGFTWRQDRQVVVKGKTLDIKQIMDRGHPGAPGSYLYGGITNAVPFISGQLYRKPDEDYPKIMSFGLGLKPRDYEMAVFNALKEVHDIHDKHALRPVLDLVRSAMVVGETSTTITLTARDLVDDGMIVLDDDDDGMW